VSGIVRRSWVSVGTCSAKSALCRDVHGEEGLFVGTSPAKSAYCRDMYCEVGLMSGHVRGGRLSVAT